MATTLDPANIHNFSGTGTLSGGDLTLASTGNSTAQSTTSASGKKTFQYTISAGVTYWPTSGLCSSSSASDGFWVGFQSAWSIYNSSGAAVITGPSSPTPAAGMVVTVDVDTVGQTVSVRANGTTVFSNADISSLAPTTWNAIVWATDASQSGTTFTSTAAFSGLTYPPLAGYSEWDGGTSVSITGASAAALAGDAVSSISDSASITGAPCAAQAGTTSTQTADSVSVTGASASALAGAVATQSSSGSTVNLTGAAVSALAGSVTSATSDQISVSGASAAVLAGLVGGDESTDPAGAACAALAGNVVAAIQAIASGAMAAALAGGIALGLASMPDGAEAQALAGSVTVQDTGAVSISGAAAQALAGDVTTNIVVTRLNPNYIARGNARDMVALGFPRAMVAAGARRDRIVVGISNAMSQTNNLTPPIDAEVETETVTFDYGNILKPGVILTGTPTITCVVYSGEDPDPTSRIIGDWSFGPSPNTGEPTAAVLQLFGQMVAGATYRLQCVCPTSDGQELSLWTHLGCDAPN